MSFYRDGLRHPTHVFEAALWGYSIKVRCDYCGHSAIFEASGLWARFEQIGWEDSLRNARRLLWCSNCSDFQQRRRPGWVGFVEEQPTIRLRIPSGIDVQKALKRYR